MTTDVAHSRIDNAQAAWELARIDSNWYDVAADTQNPQRLADMYRTFDMRSDDHSLLEALLLRRSCPAEVVADIIANVRLGWLVRDAVAHPNCPAELAVSATRWDTVRSARSFTWLPRPVLEGIVVAAPSHERIAVADEVALANHGFISEKTSPAVRRWLDTRDITHLTGDGNLLGRVLVRADVTDDEKMAAIAEIAPIGNIDVLTGPAQALEFAQISDAVAIGVLPAVRRAWGDRLIVSLLGVLPLSGQIELLKALPNVAELDASLLDAMRWNLTTSEQLRPHLQPLLDSAPPLVAGAWDEKHQAQRPLIDMLDAYAAAPRALWQLDDSQLEAFVALAARWKGTFGELVAIASRT